MSHTSYNAGLISANGYGTVYPTVYPSDMLPILPVKNLVTNIYIRAHYSGWYFPLLVFRVLCILVFWGGAWVERNPRRT